MQTNKSEKILAWMGFKPVTCAIPVQCSSNRLSYQANWELAMLWVPNIPIKGEEYKWIYESSCIAKNYYEDMIDHRCYAHNLIFCEIKAWKKSGLKGIRTHALGYGFNTLPHEWSI